MSRAVRKKKEPSSIHGTAVLWRGKGILFSGKSQMGKSDLALRLMDKGARLVADDIVNLTVRDGRIYASAPDALRNKLEVRGVGICTFDGISEAKIDLFVELKKKYDRLPKKGEVFTYRDVSVPSFTFSAFEESILLKLRLIIDILFG